METCSMRTSHVFACRNVKAVAPNAFCIVVDNSSFSDLAFSVIGTAAACSTARQRSIAFCTWLNRSLSDLAFSLTGTPCALHGPTPMYSTVVHESERTFLGHSHHNLLEDIGTRQTLKALTSVNGVDPSRWSLTESPILLALHSNALEVANQTHE